MNEVRKVKTAVVGCGMISNIYIRNLKHMFSIIDLVALCDVNQAVAEEKARLYGVDRVMTLEEVAESDEIELVVNLTGPAAHYDVIKRFLLAGKHVFTEKVLATSLEQGRELVQIAEEKKLYLGVAPDTILGAGLQTARKVLDAGLIGQVTSCLVAINRNQLLNSERFLYLKGNGGALPMDVGIYYIAAVISLLGSVKSVCGFGAPALEHEAQLLFQSNVSDKWRIPGNNLIASVLEFESGALASMHFDGNTIAEEKSHFVIYGTEGILELGDPDKFNGYVKLTRPEAEVCEIPFTHGYDGKPLLPEPTRFEQIYGHRGVGVAEMAWAIRMNRPNRCSKEIGLHALEILLGLDEAAKTGKRFEIQSRFEITGLKSGYMSSLKHGTLRGDAERSLIY